MTHTKKSLKLKQCVAIAIVAVAAISAVGNVLRGIPPVVEQIHSAADQANSPCDDCTHSAAAQEPENIEHANEAQREELEGRSVDILVTDSSDGSHTTQWTLSVAAHSNLITFEHSVLTDRYGVDTDVLTEILEAGKIDGMQALVQAHVSLVESDGYTLRARTENIARDGFAYDIPALAKQIEKAIEQNIPTVSLTLPYEQAQMTIETASGAQTLSLLATGISDYSDSPEERVWNVHKAINERVNNVAVAVGEKFSFNATLGGPVTLDKGWKEGMGLFGGGAALTPGAGICQAATTVFRAALLAGLPITQKRNHSMFVDHYEPYGVGLDATIFPGVHDLSFINDTSSTIIIQSYTKGDLVYVNIYGVPDGRTVELDGPYFSSTKDRAIELRPLAWDQIGWVRRIMYTDGSVTAHPLVATYHKGFMKAVVNKYAGTPGTALLSSEQQDTL